MPTAIEKPVSEPMTAAATADSGSTTWYFGAAAVVVLAFLVSPFDLPLADFFKTDPCPGAVRDLLEMSEAYGHALGVLLIITAVVVLDQTKIRQIPRLLAATLGAGVIADIIKLATPRYRPRAGNFEFASVWDTFETPFSTIRLDGAVHSFPSAHTSVAFGLAVCLTCFYARGRNLFIFLGLLCGLHRMQSSAHYLTDVLCGAAIGMTVATACFRVSSLCNAFDRTGSYLESKLAKSDRHPVITEIQEEPEAVVAPKRDAA